MTSIRWLHLSDFHQGIRGQKSLWPNMRERFFKDLGDLHKATGPWDLVLFTGDLTQRGEVNEFASLSNTLSSLWEHFRKLGSEPILLTVPGNHDLSRPPPMKPAVKVFDRWIEDPEMRQHFWEAPASEYRETIRDAFANYSHWSQNHMLPKPSSVSLGVLPGDFSCTFVKDGARLGILGLNSAFLQLTANNYFERLDLGVAQLHDACGGDGASWAASHDVCFLLTHHPPEWLCPAGLDVLTGEIAPEGRFLVHFFGHMHEGKTEGRSTSGGDYVRHWQAASLFGLEYWGASKEARIHGYSAGVLQLEAVRGSLRNWPRIAVRRRGGVRAIDSDQSFHLEDDKGTRSEEFRLPGALKTTNRSAEPFSRTRDASISIEAPMTLSAAAKTLRISTIEVGNTHKTYQTKSIERIASDAFSQLISQLNDQDKDSDVLVVTAHNMDEIAIVDRIDGDHECEALSGTTRAPGGSGANTAYAMGFLGAKAQVTGMVGGDADGQLLVSSLAAAGIDTSLVQTHAQAPTGRTTTLVEEGGPRFIVVFPGANNMFSKEVDYARLERAALRSKIVHLSSFVGDAEFQMQERLARAVAGTSLVSLTPGAIYARRGLDRLQPILRHVGAVFLYVEQLGQLILNSTAKSLVKASDTQGLIEALFSWRRDHGLRTPLVVVVKEKVPATLAGIGQRFLSVGVGSEALERYFSPKGLPKHAKLPAIDTTGAGDAAAAGFLVGMLQKASLESCIDSAFLLASFASTQIGARTAFNHTDAKGLFVSQGGDPLSGFRPG